MPEPETEIVVEGEPWTGIVPVKDRRKSGPGEYGLVRADEWCRHPYEVTVWKGPKKRDEVVRLKDLRETTCRTVLVDRQGFYVCIQDPDEVRNYPCPELSEDLIAEVEREKEKLLDEWANEEAARNQSQVDYEDAEERFESDEIWALAEFGDAVAVNGESVLSQKGAKPPKRWIKFDEIGGSILGGGHESEFDKESLIDTLSYFVSKKLNVDPWAVRRIVNMSHPKDYVYWSSDRGHSEVWASPKAMKKYEAAEEARRMEEEERARRKREEEHRLLMEQRAKEEAERRERIRKGGYPAPIEWSPRGRLPREE
jgi:hypothetical protein